MKQLNYFFPLVIIDLLRFLRILFKYPAGYYIVRKNKILKNIKQGKTVYVLANGPSLNNFNVETLYGKDVIVMNHFELSPWKDKVTIIAHCIGEPHGSPSWEDPELMIDNTNSQTYWFHISAKKYIDKSSYSKNKKIHYFLSSVPPGLWRNGASINLASNVLGYQTTAQMAIMVGIYLGYNKIFLLGFDHDWLCQRGISPHFYEERDNIPKADLSKFSYLELINFSQNMWKIYHKIKSSSLASKTEIINLSRPTYLDVFDYE